MKFLVIQQKMIGDVLTSSIICDNLKREFPGAIVHYMVHKHTTPVVEHHPSIDRILSFDPKLRKNKLHFYRYIQTLKEEHYDVLIDPYSKIETCLIAFFSNIPKRLAYYKWYTSFAYTHPEKRYETSKYGLGLAVEHRLQLIMPLLKDKKMSSLIHKPFIHLKKTEVAAAIALLKAHGLSERDTPYMISILGSGNNKSYPAAYMASILDQIIEEAPAWMLFNYIPKQYEEVKKIYDHCKPETRKWIKLELYADSLRGFIALLSQCRALIGNEGGAVNMAKALNIPTFSIFAPWIPKGDWAIFEDENNQSIHLNDLRPELFSGLDKKQIKTKSQELYRLFTPDMVKPKLLNFLRIQRD